MLFGLLLPTSNNYVMNANIVIDPKDRNNCFYILKCIRHGLYINDLYLGSRELESRDGFQIGAALKATKVLETLSICNLFTIAIREQ